MARVAMTVDIEKAFLNIEVDKADRDSLRCLWATNPLDDNLTVETYRFCRVVFGVKSSPFLLSGNVKGSLATFLTESNTLRSVLPLVIGKTLSAVSHRVLSCFHSCLISFSMISCSSSKIAMSATLQMITPCLSVIGILKKLP